MNTVRADGVTPQIVTLPPHPALSVTPDESHDEEEVYVPPGAMRWRPPPEK